MQLLSKDQRKISNTETLCEIDNSGYQITEMSVRNCVLLNAITIGF